MTVRVAPLPILAATVAAALLLSSCGGDDGEAVAEEHDPGLEHVHGLGINPADGALYIATHYGVFRSAPGSTSAERVGEGLQDTMGFTVVGPDHFLASGHPAINQPGPVNLGLIESTDGGESWSEVSLGGQADFHALVAAHDRIYGYDATGNRLMLSDDGGATWAERAPPGPILDLAVDPTDPERIVATTERGVVLSEDDGGSWEQTGRRDAIGFLTWPARGRLYLIDLRGNVRISSDDGSGWERVGEIGGQPVALLAEGPRELYASLPEGTILHSTDGGSSWEVRTRP